MQMPTNTLRMDAAAIARLHEEIDNIEEAGRVAGKYKREFQRWPYRKVAIRIDMMQPGGQPTELHYACRNLSNAGIGVLHSAYVHLGTPCVVYLPKIGGGVTQAEGKVIRCRHYKGYVHEIGVRFMQSINPRDYVAIDPMRGNFTLEQVDPARLTGSVLHVDDSAMDRRLLRHYLRDTELNVVGVEDGAQALARADEAFDLILCDDDLPDMSGLTLVEQLRSHGVQAPIIVLGSESAPEKAAEARDAKANAFLTKPFSRQELICALAEFLLADQGGEDMGGAIYSTLGPDHETYLFVAEFIEELHKTAGSLSNAIVENDLAAAKRLCFQIRGSAPSLGFGVLAESAETSIDVLKTAKELADAAKQLRALVFMCMRTRVKAAEQTGKKPEAGAAAKAEAQSKPAEAKGAAAKAE